MAKKVNKTEEQLVQVEQALSKTEQYIEENQKSLTIIVGAIIAIVGLYLGYQNFYIKPLEEEAQSEMFMAQLYFEKDSFSLALNGDGQYYGFIDINDEYPSTKAGNLASYYAGLCYLHTQDYEMAIEYLSNFSTDSEMLSSLALGCIGDAYLELDELDEALDYYEDATQNSNNIFTAPRYMMKQAMIHEINKNYEDALELYQEIKSSYKESKEFQDIDKYISRIENR